VCMPGCMIGVGRPGSASDAVGMDGEREKKRMS